MAERLEKAREQAIETLRAAVLSNDTEVAHARADDALCDLLVALGHDDVVEAFRNVRKWYT